VSWKTRRLQNGQLVSRKNESKVRLPDSMRTATSFVSTKKSSGALVDVCNCIVFEKKKIVA
jgi:hypothetical protein